MNREEHHDEAENLLNAYDEPPSDVVAIAQVHATLALAAAPAAEPALGEVSGRYWTLPLTGVANVQVFEYEGRLRLYVTDESGKGGSVVLSAAECRAVATALLRVAGGQS